MGNYLKKADENLIFTIKNRMKHIKDSIFIEKNGYVIYSIGEDSLDGHLNGGICLDDSKAEEFLHEIYNVFSPIKRDYAIWVRDNENEKLESILKKKGLKAIREPGSACMVCENKINTPNISSKYKMKVVESEKDVNDLKSVVQNAFEKEENVTDIMFNLNMLNNNSTKAIVLYDIEEKRPVSSAITSYSNGISGIYWVGTLDSYRGQGLGAYIASKSTNIGFENGNEIVILQASEAGERVYKKLGYKVISHYRSYRVKF